MPPKSCPTCSSKAASTIDARTVSFIRAKTYIPARRYCTSIRQFSTYSKRRRACNVYCSTYNITRNTNCSIIYDYIIARIVWIAVNVWSIRRPIDRVIPLERTSATSPSEISRKNKTTRKKSKNSQQKSSFNPRRNKNQRKNRKYIKLIKQKHLLKNS